MEIINTIVEEVKLRKVPLDAAFIGDAANRGVRIFYFDGTCIKNKTDFFNSAKDVMHLPDYFGDNWDAFEECLNDLSWISADGYILVYDYSSVFFSNHPEDSGILLSILNDARESSVNGDIPFDFVIKSSM